MIHDLKLCEDLKWLFFTGATFIWDDLIHQRLAWSCAVSWMIYACTKVSLSFSLYIDFHEWRCILWLELGYGRARQWFVGLASVCSTLKAYILLLPYTSGECNYCGGHARSFKRESLSLILNLTISMWNLVPMKTVIFSHSFRIIL